MHNFQDSPFASSITNHCRLYLSELSINDQFHSLPNAEVSVLFVVINYMSEFIYLTYISNPQSSLRGIIESYSYIS